MATDDTQTMTDDTVTQDQTSAETAADRTGADHDTGTSTVDAAKLRAENERIKKALSEANRKALADRKRLEDIDREKQEREDAKLGEAERLKKQLKDFEDRIREADRLRADAEAAVVAERINREIERAAIPLFTHPELASQVVDRDRIVHDPETGKISGIKDALEAVLKKYPGLGSSQRGGGSPAAMIPRRPGNGGGSQGDGPDKLAEFRAEFARMKNYEPM